jgi:dTDP-4-amino-4,6-dideoxygalactose transaminase
MTDRPAPPTGSRDDVLAVDGGTPVRTALIPTSRATIDDTEVLAAAEAVRGHRLTGDGVNGRAVEVDLAAMLGVPKALFMNSCTSALEVAVRLTGAGSGDEVVLPSFTFVSCANAVIRAGARPIFAEIDPDTLNIDPAAIERALTPRTRAVIVVHYAGRACDMAAIMDLARRHQIRVIEDAAHGLGARWNGQRLGTIGDFGTFSFHGTKDVVCGEGGALVCREAADSRRAEVIREKGTNRSAFLRGQVDKYTWVDEGSSFVGSDVLAAILRVQLRRLPDILARKRVLAARLTSALAPIARRASLPHVWDGIESSWHLYPILVPTTLRDRVLAALGAEGIGATFHYVPLHDSPYAREHLGGRTGDLPVTERVSASLVRLPLFASMSDADLDDVARATLKVIGHLVPAPRAPLHG